MKISIQTLGTLGDVLPFLTLAHALQERGHTVTVLAPRDHTERIRESGVEPAAPPDFSVAGWMREAEQRGTLTGPFAFFRDWPRMIRPHVEDVLERSVEAAEGADLVLANPIAMPARIAAEHWQTPFALMALQPVIVPTRALPCAMIARRAHSGWMNRASYLAVTASLAALGLAVRKHRARLVRPPRAAFWKLDRHLGRPLPRITTLPAVFDVQQPTDTRDGTYWIDYPPLVSKNKSLPADLVRFLKAGAPPIHLGLGSMPPDDLADDLPVWLSRIEASGHRALISRSLADCLRTIPDTCHVYDHAPHDVLFRHCRLVIHHGGAGTLDTAARAGVPQLILPQVLDQFWNASRLAQDGLTPSPMSGTSTPKQIDDLLTQALAAPARAKAQSVALELENRQPLSRTVDLIESLAQTR